jgi:hypothetical protein
MIVLFAKFDDVRVDEHPKHDRITFNIAQPSLVYCARRAQGVGVTSV